MADMEDDDGEVLATAQERGPHTMTRPAWQSLVLVLAVVLSIAVSRILLPRLEAEPASGNRVESANEPAWQDRCRTPWAIDSLTPRPVSSVVITFSRQVSDDGGVTWHNCPTPEGK